MTKRSRILPFILAVVFCAAAAGINVTTAYMSDRKETVNELSPAGQNALNGILTEPHWNPEKGLLVLPGETIAKDPQITNISEISMDGLAALKVEFVYGNGCGDKAKIGSALSEEDMEYVCDVYQIDWNADSLGDWVRFDGETEESQTQQFYYKNVLKRNFPGQGDTTRPLFTQISVPKNVSSRRYSHIQQMGGFDLLITGTILQQMKNETVHGLNSSEEAYHAGLFTFSNSQAEGSDESSPK